MNEIKDKVKQDIEDAGIPMKKQDRLDRYPKTDVFQVIDTKTIPHMYIATQKLLGYISTNFDGNISREAIKAYEEEFGASCDVDGCNLTIEEHLLAIVIQVKTDKDTTDVPGINEFQKQCIPFMLEDGVSGFVFEKEQVKDYEPS